MVTRQAEALADVSITGTLDVANRDELGDVLANADVYIDFSTPEATTSVARAARDKPCAAVIGTTGLSDVALSAIDDLSGVAPVLVAANFSLGVNLLIGLAESAARALPGFDLEVVELHHRRKRDAPSGTAIALARALARGRGVGYDEAKRYERSGDVGPRTDDEIGVVAVRGGDIVGEHTAFVIGDNERIELTHRAASRSLFADGAIAAARWLQGRAPGHYTMRDVLGL